MLDFQIDVNPWERDMQYVQAMESTSQAGLNARSRRMPRRNMQFDTERVCFSSLFIYFFNFLFYLWNLSNSSFDFTRKLEYWWKITLDTFLISDFVVFFKIYFTSGKIVYRFWLRMSSWTSFLRHFYRRTPHFTKGKF